MKPCGSHRSLREVSKSIERANDLLKLGRIMFYAMKFYVQGVTPQLEERVAPKQYL
jgi:hypothetical protein